MARATIQSISRLGQLVLAACMVIIAITQAEGQTTQQVEVKIRNFTFVTKQVPLHLGVPTVISIWNEDTERHDFGSTIFEGTPTQVQSGNAVAYGKGIGGVFVDPKGEVVIRFTIDRPGRYQFKCSIHPEMKGEILLLNVEAV